MESSPLKTCLMIVPGIGCFPIHKANWYTWLAESLTPLLPNFDIIVKDMPDPKKARESYWVPFIESKINNYSKRFLIGHSSGTEAIMRLLETTTYIDGVFLVSGCVSDLGSEVERFSGYYPQQMDGSFREWRWDEMKKHSGWIMHIGSEDDQFIPVEEMRVIRDKLGLDQEHYIEFKKEKGYGHFLRKKFPELLEIVKKKLIYDNMKETESKI